MQPFSLYYATNRHHLGDDVHPSGYDSSFSDDGHENLRFGKLGLPAGEDEVGMHLKARVVEFISGIETLT